MILGSSLDKGGRHGGNLREDTEIMEQITFEMREFEVSCELIRNESSKVQTSMSEVLGRTKFQEREMEC